MYTASTPARQSSHPASLFQSKAGIENADYLAQRSLLAKVDGGEISAEEFKLRAGELLAAERD